MRRFVVMVALVLGSLGLVAPIEAAGAAPVALSTSPVLVVPGTTATVTGPAVTCPNGEGDSLVVEAPDLTAPVVAPQDVPLSVQLPVPGSAAQAVYELVATCVPYQGASTVVGQGWLTVTDAGGLPPGPSIAVVSDTELTWDQQFEVSCPDEWFAPGSDVQVWMYSDPVLLGTFTASATGSMVGQLTMPTGSALGSHTMVLAGQDASGKPTFLTVGITVGQAAGQQVTTTTTTTPATTATTSAAGVAVTAVPSTASSGTLPQTGGGIGLALPAAGLVGLGSLLAALSRWRDHLDRRRG